MQRPKIVRITTVPLSLAKLLTGQGKFMRENGFHVVYMSSTNRGEFRLEGEECDTYVIVDMTRKISPVMDMISLLKVVAALWKIRPEIVHTHTPKAGIVGMVAAWLLRVPIRLHTIAGLPLMETSGAKRWLLEFVEKVTYSCATKVYTNSHSLRKYILSQKLCKPEKLQVIGEGSSNGIDVQFYNINEEILTAAEPIRAELNISADDFVFVFVGRLVKDKGIDELVQAFTSMSMKYANVRLLLVGDFELDQNPVSTETLKLIEINRSIFSVGFKQDIRPYLALSQALVFPSYREGFPNVPMQAGCFNLPSIVTDINGCNEIVTHGVNGLVIKSKDNEALEHAMETLYLDGILYDKLSSNARKMITERFDQRNFFKLILNEYTFALDNLKNV
jgi:glycosyltransferase involved in cell wall biosynthesis